MLYVVCYVRVGGKKREDWLEEDGLDGDMKELWSQYIGMEDELRCFKLQDLQSNCFLIG